MCHIRAQKSLGLAGGDLTSALGHDSQGKLAWKAKGGDILLDVARGLHFLHSNKVAHRSMQITPDFASCLLCLALLDATIYMQPRSGGLEGSTSGRNFSTALYPYADDGMQGSKGQEHPAESCLGRKNWRSATISYRKSPEIIKCAFMRLLQEYRQKRL